MRKLVSIVTNQYLLLALILGLSLVLRLYKVDNPIADWHSWRQADTAAVARSFYKEGFNPFIPRYDDMTPNSEELQVNLHRYRFVEFPIYNTVVYVSYLLNGGVNDQIAREVSIAFAVGSVGMLFLVVRRYFDKWTALASSGMFAALPYAVYYGRTTLPEPTLVFFCLGMVYFVDRWIFENKVWLFFLSLVFISASFLVKPMALFYFAPLGYSYWIKERKIIPPLRYWLLLILALLPFTAWRIWMQNFPEGIPASKWLFNGNNIRFRPAFWYWIIGQRLGGVILGVVGFALMFFGIVLRPSKKEGYLWHYLLLGMIGYLVVFATGNVQHDYYQYLIVPVVCVFVGRAAVQIMSNDGLVINRWVMIPVMSILIGLTFYLPWLQVKGYYQVNDWAIVEAGRSADQILPKDAVVVASYGGDSAFLYQTNRNGFTVLTGSIEDMKKQFGVGYYLSTAKDAGTKEIMSKYKVLVDNDRFVIVDVTGSASR